MGAWIETLYTIIITQRHTVAPYVGAWIETRMMIHTYLICMSHHTWVRGLKLEQVEKINVDENVAPYVGAWIETQYFF